MTPPGPVGSIATPRTVVALTTMAALIVSATLEGFVVLGMRIGFAPSEHRLAAWWSGLGALVLATVATTLLVALARRRAETVGGVVGLKGAEAVRQRIDVIADRLGVRGLVEVRVMALDRRAAGHVRAGRSSRPLVVLSGGLLHTFRTSPDAFNAIVAHEFAHVRNGDALPTAVADAAWRVTLVMGFAPALAFLFLGEDWFRRAGFAGLMLLMLLVRWSVLRSRELWADVRAGEAGFGADLHSLLSTSTRRAAWWRTLSSLSHHPARRARLAALRGADLTVYAIPAGGVLLAGLSFGVSLSVFTTMLSNVAGSIFGPVAGSTLTMLVPAIQVIPLVLVVARISDDPRFQWRPYRAAMSLVAFAIGAATGTFIDPGTGRTVRDGMSWAALPDLPPLTAWSLNAAIFLVAGALVAAWSRGLGAAWSAASRPSKGIRSISAVAVMMQTCVVLYAAQWVTWQVLSEHGAPIADWEASTRSQAAAATTAAFDVVPYAAREVLTGTAFFVLDDWPIIVGACVAVIAPLLGFLLGLPRRTIVRSAVALALGLVVVEMVDSGGAIAVVSGAVGTIPEVAQLQLGRNIALLVYFVQLLAGMLLTLHLTVFARRIPVTVAVAVGTAFTLLSLALNTGLRPVRCAITAAPSCRTEWSFATFALIVFATVAPTLLCCAATAGIGWLGRRAAERLDAVRLGGPTAPGQGPLPAS